MHRQLVVFSGGASGLWRVTAMKHLSGPVLARVPFVDLSDGGDPALKNSAWKLEGTSSHLRYTNANEASELSEKSLPVSGKSQRAALIPIGKSPEWWALAQDQRREIIAEQSEHFRIGLEYTPAISRRLLHCPLPGAPFDFLTWFEYDAMDSAAFEELCTRLRNTKEWAYVDRETDIRLERVTFS